MDSRRNFLGKVASGLAGTLAVGPVQVLGANDRIRVGFIGAGDRGIELAHHLRACPNTEIAAFSDIYTVRLGKAKGLVPAAATYVDYRRMLEDESIDAVVIATPQHLHAEHFCASLDAGKHIYQENTLAFTVDQAKRMRIAYRRDGGRHVVQIGHQCCSFGQMADVEQFLGAGERMGKITAIQMHMHRNTPRSKPPWARPALIRPELNAENVLWSSFLGEAPPREFDAHRFVHWRYFWDYSGGGVYENMCHQISFWYKALQLQIPKAATMTGGVLLWKDGREVPDTMSVSLQQPEDMLIHWTSGFGNNQLGVREDVLGTNGTISRDSQVRYLPQKLNRPEDAEMLGRSSHVPHVHMQNFLESIRSRREPGCPFELGFRVSIACRMAVESYRQGRTVHWDSQKEEIV